MGSGASDPSLHANGTQRLEKGQQGLRQDSGVTAGPGVMLEGARGGLCRGLSAAWQMSPLSGDPEWPARGLGDGVAECEVRVASVRRAACQPQVWQGLALSGRTVQGKKLQ